MLFITCVKHIRTCSRSDLSTSSPPRGQSTTIKGSGDGSAASAAITSAAASLSSRRTRKIDWTMSASASPMTTIAASGDGPNACASAIGSGAIEAAGVTRSKRLKPRAQVPRGSAPAGYSEIGERRRCRRPQVDVGPPDAAGRVDARRRMLRSWRVPSRHQSAIAAGSTSISPYSSSSTKSSRAGPASAAAVAARIARNRPKIPPAMRAPCRCGLKPP